MRILVAPDKFKGSLGATEVAEAIAAGLRDALPNAEVVCLPVADGGEGTAAVICRALDCRWVSCAAHDAMGHAITVRYGIAPDGETAVMEMSEAAGLARIPAAERNLGRASTFGVGEMLLDAAQHGVEEIIIGLGGSATNDGGFGLARAFGFRFRDEQGVELSDSVESLCRLARIVAPAFLHLPKITAAVDVQNPLLGPRGATRVFGRQKGASIEQIEMLEKALAHLAEFVASDLKLEQSDAPGAGAAGGLGFGLMSFARARLRPGFDLVAECIGLEAAVDAADVVITGEGQLDAQTLEGKAPAGVARLARKHGKKCFAIVGSAKGNIPIFDGIFEIMTPTMTLMESIARTEESLRARSFQLASEFLA